MKFRTEIAITPLSAGITHSAKIFALGSCFAERVSERLSRAKFSIASNPLGVLFNPLSIAAAIERFEVGEGIKEEAIASNNDAYFSFEAHSSLDGATKGEALERLNEAVAAGAKALKDADWVILTFGTAWVYEREGKVVANCHKLPASQFVRRRLSVEEIVEHYAPLLEGILQNKTVIFTVSPVRHIGDGLEGNNLSKATLRLAIEELCERYDNAHYFPSFEIMVDDLRDYRYYADDLLHPTKMAVNYIWERFCEYAISEDSRLRLPVIEQIVTAAEHRPFNPTSQAHKLFCQKMLTLAEQQRDIDFTKECNEFKKYL